MKLEIYWLFKEILLRLSYILVISRDYILLISSCPVNEVNVWKLPIVASYTSNLYHNYFKGGGKGAEKTWRIFAKLNENSTNFFVLEISTLSRFNETGATTFNSQ